MTRLARPRGPRIVTVAAGAPWDPSWLCPESPPYAATSNDVELRVADAARWRFVKTSYFTESPVSFEALPHHHVSQRNLWCMLHGAWVPGLAAYAVYCVEVFGRLGERDAVIAALALDPEARRAAAGALAIAGLTADPDNVFYEFCLALARS